MKGARTNTTHATESGLQGEIVDVPGQSGVYGGEEAEDVVNLSRRRTIIAWTALGTVLASLCLITPTQGFIFSIQFSICLAMLVLISFRWWTRPVHPGVFGYFSPHTIILLNGLLFYGIGNLPPLIFPDQIIINYGATEFYIPMLAVIVAGLAIFDGTYRLVVKWSSLNDYIERGMYNFFTPGIQNVIPLYTILAYLVCRGLFIYMTGMYLFQPFNFAGAISETDNILARVSSHVLSMTCGLMGILFFRRKSIITRLVIVIGFASLLPIFFVYQSRRLLFFSLMLLLIVYMIYNWKQLKFRWFALGGILLALAFLVISMVKMTQVRDPSISRYLTEDKNIFLRAEKIVQSEEFGRLDNLQYLLILNSRKRIAALDFPGAIMNAHISSGIPLLHGEHNLLGAAKIIPRVIWPDKPKGEIEGMIIRHYELSYEDQLTTLFASAYADWGILGVLGGGAFLAIFFGVSLRLILIRKDGILVYILSSYILLSNFQAALLMSVLFWLRWVCIVITINTIVYYIYRLFWVRHSDA